MQDPQELYWIVKTNVFLGEFGGFFSFFLTFHTGASVHLLAWLLKKAPA